MACRRSLIYEWIITTSITFNVHARAFRLHLKPEVRCHTTAMLQVTIGYYIMRGPGISMTLYLSRKLFRLKRHYGCRHGTTTAEGYNYRSWHCWADCGACTPKTGTCGYGQSKFSSLKDYHSRLPRCSKDPDSLSRPVLPCIWHQMPQHSWNGWIFALVRSAELS